MSLINLPDKIYKGSMNWSHGDDTYITIQTASNKWKIVPYLKENWYDSNKYLTIDVECLYEEVNLWKMKAEIETTVKFKNANITWKGKREFSNEKFGKKCVGLGPFRTKLQDFASTKLESGFELMIQTNIRIYFERGILSCEFSIPRNIDSEIVCRLGEHILYLDKYPLICFSTQFREMLSCSDVLVLPLMRFKYVYYVGFFRLLYRQRQEMTVDNYWAFTRISCEFGVECILSDCEDYLITAKHIPVTERLFLASLEDLARVQAKIVENITIKEIEEVFRDPGVDINTTIMLKRKLSASHYRKILRRRNVAFTSNNNINSLKKNKKTNT